MNVGASKYMKQKVAELKEEREISAIIVKIFNTFLSVIVKNKSTEHQEEYRKCKNNTINQNNLSVCIQHFTNN